MASFFQPAAAINPAVLLDKRQRQCASGQTAQAGSNALGSWNIHAAMDPGQTIISAPSFKPAVSAIIGATRRFGAELQFLFTGDTNMRTSEAYYSEPPSELRHGDESPATLLTIVHGTSCTTCYTATAGATPVAFKVYHHQNIRYGSECGAEM